MFEFLAFDLDGTLLNSEKRIDSQSKKRIKELHDNGMAIILISSRHANEIFLYAYELELGKGDYIVSCDGTYIYEINDGEPELLFKGNFLSKDDIFTIQKRLCVEEIVCIYDKNDIRVKFNRLNLKKRAKAFFEKIDLSQKKITMNYVAFKNVANNEIEKAILFSKSSLKELENDYFVLRLKDDRIEVFNKNCGKYNALCYLEEKGFIDRENLLYFGDDFNDLECFKNLKHTVAMGSAPDEIKCFAELITDDCDNYGIFKALSSV